MSLSNPTIHVPVHDTAGSWLRRHLGWMLTAVAVAAAAVLITFLVVDGDSSADPAPAQTTFSADRGSINAIDHQAETGGTDVLGHRTSVSDTEHRSGGSGKVR